MTWRTTALLLALGLAGAVRADLLILRNGTEVLGALESMEAGSLVLRTESGERRRFPRDELAKLEVYRDLSGTSVERVDGLADPLLHEVLGYVADPAAYPSAGAINLYLGEVVTFEADGSLQRRVRNVVRVLQERGKEEGTVPMVWMKDLDTAHFDFGRSYLPDGDGGALLSVRGLTDKGVRVAPAYGQFPEYDRLLQAVHTLPQVDRGVVVDWQYSTRRRAGDPFMPIWLQIPLDLSEPVLKGEVVIRVHRDLNLDVILSRRQGVVETRSEEGDFRIHHFTYGGRMPEPRESRKPPAHELQPTIYAVPRITWGELSAAVFSAYAPPAEAGSRAKEVLAQLVKPGASPAAKHQALALWIARELRLVRIPMSQFSYHPRDLEEILATRTGNHLDKSYALFSLLSLAGLPAELYLIRDRYAGALPEGISSLGLFNDAAVRVKLGEEGWVFCDADEVDLGPRDLPGSFYGAPALRVHGAAPAEELTEIPSPPMEVDLRRAIFSNQLMPDGGLVGTRALTVRGNSATIVRSYRNLSQEDLRKRMESLNHQFHPSAILVGYQFLHLGDFTKDVLYERSYRVPGYALRAGGQLMAFHIPGLVDSIQDAAEPTRRYPLAFAKRALHLQQVVVKLPPGYRVIHHPEGLDLRGAGWSYLSEIRVEDGALCFDYRYERTAYRIAPGEYPDYRQMRRLRAEEAQAWVVIESTEDASSPR